MSSSLQPKTGLPTYGAVETRSSKERRSSRRALLELADGKQKSARSKKVGLPPPQRGASSKRWATVKKGVFSKLFTPTPVHRPAAVKKKKAPMDGHSFVYDLLNPRSKRRAAVLFKNFIAFVICFDMISFIISTEPDLQGHTYFYVLEGVTSSIFLVEYIARLAVISESKKWGKFGPIKGRLSYMLSSNAVIDALATFPFFIELWTGVELPTLTYLRFFRLLRIHKTRSFSKAMGTVTRVLYYNREILYVASVMCIFLILITGVAMYYLRPQEDVADASSFESISATMVLATLMLTGQGGPQGDLPWYTQCIVLVTGVFSIAMFAIPASMLTWGFEAEAERLATHAKKRAYSQRNSSFLPSSSSSESSSDDDDEFSSLSTSDEEYLNIIGGDVDDGDAVVPSVEDSAALAASAEIVPNAAPNMEEAASLLSRIEKLEAKVDKTNQKLDKLVRLLEKRT